MSLSRQARPGKGDFDHAGDRYRRGAKQESAAGALRFVN
jgi:hypothetical protein